MKTRNILFTAVVMMFAIACGRGTKTQERPTHPYGFFPEEYKCDSITVKPGETFSNLMVRLGMSAGDAYALTQMCSDSVFNMRKFRAGNTLEAFRDSLSGRLEYVTYHHDMVRTTIFHCADSLYVNNVYKPTTHERRYADVHITESLWNDMQRAGASTMLIAQVEDIFQWSVDLFHLHEGDRFRVIYSQTLCEDEVYKIDTVHFCIFNSGKREVPAVRFDIGKGSTYWGKDGESLKRMFLKAPLKFSRISSKFSYARKHPLTGKVRPHTAVDYAAPTGTPVQAIGNGKVTACGWDGSGGGNRIRIKHAQGYESCYMHLSKFAKGLKVGSYVHQGETIGYVGSTGHSTGPHLDFRIWHNGKPINPLTLDSPSSEPLDKKYLDDFNVIYNGYMKELEQLAANGD